MSDTKTGAGEVVKGPLDGLRVIELGTLLAGPFCGQLLGDFGAEVIKVEPPGQGDPMRTWGQEKINGKSLWWPVVARNKKAITLDLRQPEGQCVLKELVAKSDFLLENFRPGTMEKWGLGYGTLSELNPGLIMIRVSGYGQTGPYSRQAGFGSIGEAMGGLRYVVGDPDHTAFAHGDIDRRLARRHVSPAWVRWRRCSTGSAPGGARSWTRRSTKPC